MELNSPADWVVFIIVVGLRFLLPLLIPIFPLPAIIVCLLLDGVDQTIFQSFTTMSLDGYQGYDKALDIYYLTVAYISTFRNWVNSYAFRTSRFLYYYRLVGVVLFELTQFRPLLLIFPNVFEYFFIWYEAVRLLWNPARLTRRAILIAAAAIWIFIKLPQEYWIHIAQLDATDVVKRLLGGTPESAWGALIADNVVLIAGFLLVVGAGCFFLYRYLRAHLPPRDHGIALRADDNTERPTDAQLALARRTWEARIFDRDLVEKIALVGLVTVVFAKILPGATATPLGIIFDVALFITANTTASHFLARRGRTVTSGIVHFLIVLTMNYGLVWLGSMLSDAATNWFNATFFVVLLSLIVTLFDRFQPVHLARFPRQPLPARG
ncbi:conserved membrane protein of unknown function [Candidatus Promineifilum breve]|uniref:Uncharacterized protein n=1 Tax=Candidatus Promineifilum breve TaxID=1806508 RepID=A0A160T6X9_9CHLR|nr:hypothetical protein [Candidatus Promineifilum breve]CUS04805.2 conserved membrane protein of unknown function [Candidatus Promineifilum breve]